MLSRRSKVKDFTEQMPSNISNLTLQTMNCLAGLNAESSEGNSLSDRYKACRAGVLGSKADQERRLQEKRKETLVHTVNWCCSFYMLCCKPRCFLGFYRRIS